MENKVLIGTWFLLTLLATMILISIRAKRSASLSLKLEDAIHIMIGTLSYLSGLNLLYKFSTVLGKIEPIVGVEGVVSMFIGILATVWFGVTEIAILIHAQQPPNKP